MSKKTYKPRYQSAKNNSSETQDDAGQVDNVSKWQRFKAEWGGFIILLFCLFTFRSVIADWNAVPTGSMKPTIYEGDRIWVNKLTYGLRLPFTNIRLATLGQPKHGEIVVFPEPRSGKRYIKRVIGLAGDVVQVKNNKVYLNNQPLAYREYSESELKSFYNIPTSPSRMRNNEHFLKIEENAGGQTHVIQVYYQDSNFGPVTVPDGKIFVMGDNRDESQDSRYIGFIDSDTLIGRATRVVWSHDYENYYLFRKERFFKPIDELSQTE
jgi:signal peptidase I